MADERVRAAVRRLLAATRARARQESQRLATSGQRLVHDVVGAELLVVVAFAFGVGLLLGRRRR